MVGLRIKNKSHEGYLCFKLITNVYGNSVLSFCVTRSVYGSKLLSDELSILQQKCSGLVCGSLCSKNNGHSCLGYKSPLIFRLQKSADKPIYSILLFPEIVMELVGCLCTAFMIKTNVLIFKLFHLMLHVVISFTCKKRKIAKWSQMTSFTSCHVVCILFAETNWCKLAY